MLPEIFSKSIQPENSARFQGSTSDNDLDMSAAIHAQ